MVKCLQGKCCTIANTNSNTFVILFSRDSLPRLLCPLGCQDTELRFVLYSVAIHVLISN